MSDPGYITYGWEKHTVHFYCFALFVSNFECSMNINFGSLIKGNVNMKLTKVAIHKM